MPDTTGFQVGDRVRCVRVIDDSGTVLNLTGTVSSIGYPVIDVAFDNFTGVHGRDGATNHWYVVPEALELLTPTFSIATMSLVLENACATAETALAVDHVSSTFSIDEPEPAVYCPTCNYEENDCRCSYCEHCEESYCGDECPSCENIIAGYRYNVLNRYQAIPPFSPKTKNTLYLGVELEVESKDNAVRAARRLLDDQCSNNWLICKHDGSLDDGFEAVTVPAILEEHKKRWKPVLANLKKTCTSWKNRTTGLHVHLSRSYFTQLEIAKFVLFINSEQTRPWVVTLAGRSCPEYAQLKKKEIADIDRSNSDRYEAVNLQNNATIEVRIFKGTLKEEHVLADIEFCHALASWVKINSVQECDNWSAFMEFVGKHKKEYSNLLSYMESKTGAISEMLSRQFALHTQVNMVDLTGGETE